MDSLFFEDEFAEVFELYSDDLAKHVFIHGLEFDDVIESIEELWAEKLE